MWKAKICGQCALRARTANATYCSACGSKLVEVETFASRCFRIALKFGVISCLLGGATFGVCKGIQYHNHQVAAKAARIYSLSPQ